MITELILSGIFQVVDWCISLLPNLQFTGLDFSFLIPVLSFAFNFIDVNVFITFISIYMTVYLGSFAWTIVEWVYKKIPGVS